LDSVAAHSMAGLPIATLDLEDAAKYLVGVARNNKECGVHLITAHTVSLCESSPELRGILQSGDLLLADSRWLEIFSGIRHKKLSQVRGADLFRALLTMTEGTSLSHYFVGPKNSVNQALQEKLKSVFPSMHVAGFSIAPMAPIPAEYVESLTVDIKRSGASIVWVGVGTPAQNFLVHDLSRESGRVVLGVGAAFEFLSGLKPEAPRWVRVMGVEWLFRLLTEPKRLWRRYLWGNAVFLYALIKDRFLRNGQNRG